MKRADHVNLKKGQRVRLPRYGFTGVIKEIQVNSTGRIIGIGDVTGVVGEGLIYVTSGEVELLGMVAA